MVRMRGAERGAIGMGTASVATSGGGGLAPESGAGEGDACMYAGTTGPPGDGPDRYDGTATCGSTGAGR
jgi:hypothetical protein